MVLRVGMLGGPMIYKSARFVKFLRSFGFLAPLFLTCLTLYLHQSAHRALGSGGALSWALPVYIYSCIYPPTPKASACETIRSLPNKNLLIQPTFQYKQTSKKQQRKKTRRPWKFNKPGRLIRPWKFNKPGRLIKS